MIFTSIIFKDMCRMLLSKRSNSAKIRALGVPYVVQLVELAAEYGLLNLCMGFFSTLLKVQRHANQSSLSLSLSMMR